MVFLPLCSLCLCGESLSTTNEVNNLDTIVVADNCFGPVGTADDGAVQLDGDTLFWQRKKLQQFV